MLPMLLPLLLPMLLASKPARQKWPLMYATNKDDARAGARRYCSNVETRTGEKVGGCWVMIAGRNMRKGNVFIVCTQKSN